MLDIQSIKYTLEPIFKKYKIKSAYLFGSYARGEAGEDSDVDIRIEKGDNFLLESLLQVCHFENDMKDVLNKPVHLITHVPQDRYSFIFRKNLSKDEVKIYGN